SPSLCKHLVHVLSPLHESSASLRNEFHQPIEIRRTDVELAEARRQTISLIDRRGGPLVTECLKHIRSPACRMESRQGFVCAAVSLYSQRLSQEYLHGR